MLNKPIELESLTVNNLKVAQCIESAVKRPPSPQVFSDWSDHITSHHIISHHAIPQHHHDKAFYVNGLYANTRRRRRRRRKHVNTNETPKTSEKNYKTNKKKL